MKNREDLEVRGFEIVEGDETYTVLRCPENADVPPAITVDLEGGEQVHMTFREYVDDMENLAYYEASSASEDESGPEEQLPKKHTKPELKLIKGGLAAIALLIGLNGCAGVTFCYSKSTGKVSQCSSSDFAKATRCKTEGEVTGCYVP